MSKYLDTLKVIATAGDEAARLAAAADLDVQLGAAPEPNTDLDAALARAAASDAKAEAAEKIAEETRQRYIDAFFKQAGANDEPGAILPNKEEPLTYDGLFK